MTTPCCKNAASNVVDVTGSQVYIYSESYGGKMAAQFALAIHRAQQKRHIYLTFRCDSPDLASYLFCLIKDISTPRQMLPAEPCRGCSRCCRVLFIHLKGAPHVVSF